MPPAVAHAKSMAACKRLLATEEFQQAQVVMIYLSIPGEVDITPIALRGWQGQKLIAAPRMSWDRRHMIPMQIHSLDAGMETRVNGIREPADAEPVAVDELDLVIVPALMFDRSGNRLGRGAGFYDRFLASPQFNGSAMGLAFSDQVVDEVPVSDNDVPVHVLVTEEEVMRFSSLAASGRDVEDKTGR